MSFFEDPVESSPVVAGVPVPPPAGEAHDPGSALTYAAYRDGMKLLNPLTYAADAEAAQGYGQAYWVVLHGNPDFHSEVSPRCAWITNAIWGSVVVQILRSCTKMPKPAEVETLCQVERGKLARLNPNQKALPTDSTVTPRTGRIRTENTRLLSVFQKECAKYGTAMINRGGLRSRLITQAQREGYAGDKLRLRVGILYVEARLSNPRPVMPIFFSDGGFPMAESSEKADRWNTKDDLSTELQRLRADWATMEALEADTAA